VSVATEWGYPDTSMGLTFEECVPFLCGESGTTAQITACAQAGYTGAFGCSDQICSESGFGCPAASLPATPSTPVTQSDIGTAQTQPTRSQKPGPRLTPQTLVRSFPDITAALAPAPPAPVCDLWQEMNGWIEDNPLIAAAVLAGVFFLARKKGRR